jgi:hypothetical protein
VSVCTVQIHSVRGDQSGRQPEWRHLPGFVQAVTGAVSGPWGRYGPACCDGAVPCHAIRATFGVACFAEVMPRRELPALFHVKRPCRPQGGAGSILFPRAQYATTSPRGIG